MQFLLGACECHIGLVHIVDHQVLSECFDIIPEDAAMLSQNIDVFLGQRQQWWHHVPGNLRVRRKDLVSAHGQQIFTGDPVGRLCRHACLGTNLPVGKWQDNAVILQPLGLVDGDDTDRIVARRGGYCEFVALGVPITEELSHSAATALRSKIIDTVLEGQQMSRLLRHMLCVLHIA